MFRSTSNLAKTAQPNEKLISIIISDGAPAAYNYTGSAAYEDIRRICKFFEKHYNIKTIGVGIGGGTQAVKDIYRENSVVVDDLDNLKVELLKILKTAFK